MKVIITGGVAGGASAAARLRRLDEQAEIIVFERSGYISYANCGLPYYIGGVIEDPEELTLQTPESFFARFRVHIKYAMKSRPSIRSARAFPLKIWTPEKNMKSLMTSCSCHPVQNQPSPDFRA